MNGSSFSTFSRNTLSVKLGWSSRGSTLPLVFSAFAGFPVPTYRLPIESAASPVDACQMPPPSTGTPVVTEKDSAGSRSDARKWKIDPKKDLRLACGPSHKPDIAT